ncbi:MAG: hypothetical protein H7Y42_07620 [Chitinophagaceae bacterium]|nr:hypothetical protein [Chitinophagaceae bacterium]
MTPWLVTLLVLVFACRQNSTSTLDRIKVIDNFPSGSAIEYYNERFYVIGDDASMMLSLDENFEFISNEPLYTTGPGRIPKNVKPDLEAITRLDLKDTPYLLILGSGSLAPYRQTGWLLNPKSLEKNEWRLDSFYKRLAKVGIEEVNIEGVAASKDEIILVNRGNKTHPLNHLIFTTKGFWENPTAPVRTVVIGKATDTSVFNGISGLAYSSKSDELIMTVSTENTYTSTADGTIGKSYLWIMKYPSGKNDTLLMPDKIIDLSRLDSRFEGNKIESVCIVSETATMLDLALVADNDDGKSSLFRLRVRR